MTMAVCIKCGALKFGAFNPCEKCGALPETEDDYLVSFVLTDHFSSCEALEEIGRQIARGIKPRVTDETFPPEMLSTFRNMARIARERCGNMTAYINEQ